MHTYIKLYTKNPHTETERYTYMYSIKNQNIYYIHAETYALKHLHLKTGSHTPTYQPRQNKLIQRNPHI